ncbi:MAG: hypothetical protein P4L82_17060 [Ancalomicrobiaceae bacterium]|nr:hypothetical protein [Ancalomicrobiaceae bacterium]
MSLPDPLLRYSVDAKPVHDLLRRALIQLAGFQLKRLVADRPGLCSYEPVEAARSALSEAAECLRSLGSPSGAVHHRSHLQAAAAALQRAVAAALSRHDRDGSDLFRHLEDAERQMRSVSRALPGFGPVDFGQACCAAHMRLPDASALQCSG